MLQTVKKLYTGSQQHNGKNCASWKHRRESQYNQSSWMIDYMVLDHDVYKACNM